MDHNVICGGNCCGGCLAYMGMSFIGCGCILQMLSRGHIRQKYNIPGDPCNDCCITFFCSPCSMCQEYRELVIRGHTKGGAPMAQPAVAMAPQQQPGMQAAPYPPPPAAPVDSYPPSAPAPQQYPPPGIYPPIPTATGVPVENQYAGQEMPPNKV
ncbi:hypothetical protein GPECTOR_15g312 [Gonium pectorale]|uniref:Uncharacterized protein n=1 Tax=Gonium pectorale TaxID=33097 RepID=A0A150GLH4_GONPE|nr:hypothetical protein GPECTOR_15g312 [Gonium pectorale]|eukprot:KXZ50628.1 hypothetical protein GPECTOR_15g312 [Gonium pectorale]